MIFNLFLPFIEVPRVQVLHRYVRFARFLLDVRDYDGWGYPTKFPNCIHFTVNKPVE